MLLICAAIAAGATVLLMAWGIIHPPRMTDGKAMSRLHRLSPGDLGLRFEQVEYVVRDERGRGLALAGWWIPADAADAYNAADTGRCAVLIHGYADAKVGAIAWAPVLHEAGMHILALDLRAHGESEGDYITAGFFERHDLAQVLCQLRATRPASTQQLVLFGASTGAAVALAAATLEDGAPPIAGLILESPFADFRKATMANLNRLSAPGRFFQLLALRVAAVYTGSNFAEVSPIESLPRATVPIMMILPDSDPLISPDDRARLAALLADRANPRDSLWLVSRCSHLLALEKFPADIPVGCRHFCRR